MTSLVRFPVLFWSSHAQGKESVALWLSGTLVDKATPGFALLLEELQSNSRGSEGKDEIVLVDDGKNSISSNESKKVMNSGQK